jgi:hypothetical protein
MDAGSYLRHFRIFGDPIDVAVDFIPEALAQTVESAFVVFNGVENSLQVVPTDSKRL